MESMTQQLIQQLNWRYATQKFDPTRPIAPDTWAALEQSLVLTASSFGLQPWRFVVVTDPHIKDELVAASYGQKQVRDASHVVVFAIPRELDVSHVDRHITRTAEVRAVHPDTLERYRKYTASYVSSLAPDRQADWAARQVYIALGAFLTAAALLGVDTCPMEGIIPEKYDDLLGLPEAGLTTVVTCCAGHRADDDKYAAMPKVRFDPNEVIVRV
jgi:nitroreductase